MGQDSSAPKGPDYEKLLKDMGNYASQNKDIFDEALKFGKNQFSKGQEFVDRIEKFGMDAMGKLGSEAENFKQVTADRVASLDKQGQDWSKAASDIYGSNKELADKVTGELLPGMGAGAEAGQTALQSYLDKGIPFQDEYIAKIGGWDSTQRREDRAAQAVNDIAMTSEAARESELRRLESYGIDPSQTRSAALDSRLQAQNAIAKAAAANTARQAVEQEGIALGKTASDMYDTRAKTGMDAITNAANAGKTIAEIARQPGADYLAALNNLGSYGLGVGQLEQAGGTAAYEMASDAARFGERGVTNAATQQNAVNDYGSRVYDQAGQGVKQGADIINSGYQTAGNIHATDVDAWQAEQANSPWGQIGTVAGIAAPFVLDAIAPGTGTAMRAAMGVGKAASAASGGGGRPLSGTNLLNSQYGKGGPVEKEASPSRGAIPDDVPAMVDAGEYVIDRDTVRWFGEKHFADLQKKARQGRGIPERA